MGKEKSKTRGGKKGGAADDDDDHDTGSSSGSGGNDSKMCNHIGDIKVEAVAAVIPRLHKKGAAAAGGGGGGKGGKKGGKGGKSSDGGKPQWVCLICGNIGYGDSPNETAAKDHFDTRHPIGVNLSTGQCMCVKCGILTQKKASPALWKKLESVLKLFTDAASNGGKVSKGARDAAATAADDDNDDAADDAKHGSSTSGGSSSSSSNSMSIIHGAGGSRPIKGLYNLGNTCFFNSVMQNIGETLALKFWLDAQQHVLYGPGTAAVDLPMQLQLSGFMNGMWGIGDDDSGSSVSSRTRGGGKAAKRSTSNCLHPGGLFNEIVKGNATFKGNRQQDAHELLRYLIDSLAEELDAYSRKTVKEQAMNMVSLWSVDDVESWLRSLHLKSEEELLTNLRASATATPTTPPADGKMMVRLANGWAVKEGKNVRARFGIAAKHIPQDDRQAFTNSVNQLTRGTLPFLHEFVDRLKVKRAAEKDAKAAEAAAMAAAAAETAAAALAAGISLEETKQETKAAAKKKKEAKDKDEMELPTLPTTTPVMRTPIHSFFSGTLQNTVECLTCHAISTTSEQFFDLSLPIDPPYVPKKSAIKTSFTSSNGWNEPVELPRQAKNAHKRSAPTNARQKKKLAQKIAKNASSRAPSGAPAPLPPPATPAKTAPAKTPAAAAAAKKIDTDATTTATAASDATTATETTSATATENGDTSAAAAIATADATTRDTPAAAPVATTDAATDTTTATVATPATNTDTTAATTDSESKDIAVSAASDTTSSSSSAAVAATTDASNPAPPSAAEHEERDHSGPVLSEAEIKEAIRLEGEAAAKKAEEVELAKLMSLSPGSRRLLGECSLTDALAAFTDPDFLTGSNAYGCSNCTKRAADAGLAEFEEEKKKRAADKERAKAVTTPTSATAAAAIASDSKDVTATDGEGDTIMDGEGDNSDGEDDDAPKTLAEAMAKLTVTGDDGKDVPADDDTPSTEEKKEEKKVAAPVEEAADDGDDFKPPPAPKLVKRTARKRYLIDKPPRILTCHLKRFQQQGRSLEKLGKYVSFPMTLDITPYCVERKDGVSLRYRLYGVVVHQGQLGGGHYICYTRKGRTSEGSDDGQWYHFSDSAFRQASPADVSKCQAYILFYEQC